MSIDTIMNDARNLMGKNDPTPEELAGIALQLARANNEISDLLSPLKDALREVAAEKTDDNTTVYIEGGTEGKVMVTFPKTQTKLAKTFNADAAHETLGNRFSLYFDTKVTYTPRKNLGAMVKTASDQSESDFVMRCVDQVVPTPRVSFKK